MLMLNSFRNPTHGNALAGAKFHGRGSHDPLGYARLKSHTKPGAGLESPTGYRSRGPSAERQVRRLARVEVRAKAKAENLARFKPSRSRIQTLRRRKTDSHGIEKCDVPS